MEWHVNRYSCAKQNNMKSLFLILYLFNAHMHNEASNNTNTATAAASCQHLRIVLSNHADSYCHSDSVLVILDKFDHSGAGVVRKKFYPGVDHSFTITGVPEGKYYATIKCLGMHHDYLEKTIRVIKQKDNMLKVKLQDCEEFANESVVIPGEKISLAKLSVVKSK